VSSKSINNWRTYKDSLKNLSNKEKGDSFERLSKHYLTNDPKYATILKHIWLLTEVPQKIHKKLNLPKQDQGIDLICETNDGEFWAVQCKYHTDETTNQTWKSLSTFTGLAFGVCKNISFGLVCTTAERFTKTLKDQNNISFCAGEVWRNLDEDFFNSFLKKKKPKRLKPLPPYPHQKRAIKNAHEHFVNNKESRGKMIMPCGTGKSLTAFWIAEKLDSKRILIAVPSLSLIRQTLQVWLRESFAKGWNVDWITVCSDKTVSKVEKDDLSVLTQDLGIPAWTDPEKIAKWLRKKHTGKTVVFTTYQSGKAIAEAAKLAHRKFDIGIMDEAHKTVGTRDKSFAHLLFDENIKINKRVFMTATERRYAGKKDEVISMDDMNIYGDTFEFLSFKEALDENPPILSDYKIVTMMISKDEVAELVKKRAFVKPTKGKWNEEIEADMLASMIALRKAIRRFKIKHAITFHSSIAKAKTFGENQDIFSDLFPQYWKTDNFHVSGKMPTSVRDRHLKEFKTSKRAIMTNARCLTEGVDVPDIDCVLFADPKKSTIDIVQAVGRALRLSEGKKFGYVIVPVIIEDEGKFDESDAFQSILMTLRALASNDERIIDYFRAKSQNKRSYTNIQIEVDERIAERIDVKDFTRELELVVWNKLAKLSWRPFEEAKKFVHSLKLNGDKDWRNYCINKIKNLPEKPFDIPTAPWSVYKNEWIDSGDWFGTGFIAVSKRNYYNYEDAKQYVQKLGLKNQKEWYQYCKGNIKGLPQRPIFIPANPASFYKNKGWKSFNDWLGTDFIAWQKRQWLTFKDAKKFVHKLKLSGEKEWRLYCANKLHGLSDKPKNIPSNPKVVYKEFINIGDWLGTKTIATYNRNYKTYEEAKKYVHKLKLKNVREWEKYCKGEFINLKPKPDDIPQNVRSVYKKTGWKNWGKFLGTYNISTIKKIISFKEAKRFVKSLKLKNSIEWQAYCKSGKRPDDIPAAPHSTYKNKGWVSWSDFLGYESKRKKK